MILSLSLQFCAIEQYKDIAGEDFILIYPYLWRGEPNVYLTLREGASRIIGEIPSASIDEADQMLRTLYEQFAANIDLDKL